MKNRNGVTGKKISYDFYSKYNYFEEGEQENAWNETHKKQEEKHSKAANDQTHNKVTKTPSLEEEQEKAYKEKQEKLLPIFKHKA